MAIFAQITVWKKDTSYEETELIYQSLNCEEAFMRRYEEVKALMEQGLLKKAKADWFNTRQSKELCQYFNDNIGKK